MQRRNALGKLLYTETRVVEEAKQEIRAATESREASIGLLTDLLFRLGRGVAQPGLDVPMTTLLGIQLGGILRQPLDVEFGMQSQERMALG
jgi:hypothetical protein